MSDTPRTEAETFCWGCRYDDSGHEHDNVVSDKFAQGLERELDASQKECAELRNALQTLVYRYRSAPDGPLGRGLTNGAFLRAEQLLREKP